MKRVLLLRAYGDFVIALQSLLHSTTQSAYELVASSHHRSLFEALPASLIPHSLPIQFIDFGIRASMLRAFTNKHLLNPATIKELVTIANFCVKQPIASRIEFVENTHRKWLLELGTGKKFTAISGNANVYDSYHHFFNSIPPVIHYDSSAIKKILILPSARIAKRDIPENTIQNIVLKHPSLQLNIAYFRKEIPGCIAYNSFTELFSLIRESDFIYGADSLPIHVSYLLQKPHCIVYPSWVSHQFFTPYALAHRSYFTFNSFN